MYPYRRCRGVRTRGHHGLEGLDGRRFDLHGHGKGAEHAMGDASNGAVRAGHSPHMAAGQAATSPRGRGSSRKESLHHNHRTEPQEALAFDASFSMGRMPRSANSRRMDFLRQIPGSRYPFSRKRGRQAVGSFEWEEWGCSTGERLKCGGEMGVLGLPIQTGN
jgi:hypothetical protein